MNLSPIALRAGRIEDYCTAREAARIKGVSIPAVYYAIDRGALAAYDALGQTVLLRSEVNAWKLRAKSAKAVKTKKRPE